MRVYLLVMFVAVTAAWAGPYDPPTREFTPVLQLGSTTVSSNKMARLGESAAPTSAVFAVGIALPDINQAQSIMKLVGTVFQFGGTATFLPKDRKFGVGTSIACPLAEAKIYTTSIGIGPAYTVCSVEGRVSHFFGVGLTLRMRQVPAAGPDVKAGPVALDLSKLCFFAQGGVRLMDLEPAVTVGVSFSY